MLLLINKIASTYLISEVIGICLYNLCKAISLICLKIKINYAQFLMSSTNCHSIIQSRAKLPIPFCSIGIKIIGLKCILKIKITMIFIL